MKKAETDPRTYPQISVSSQVHRMGKGKKRGQYDQLWLLFLYELMTFNYFREVNTCMDVIKDSRGSCMSVISKAHCYCKAEA